MASKNVTKKPSGLTIARKGKKFTFSWKIADSDYGAGQWLNYQVQGQKVQKKKIGVKATSVLHHGDRLSEMGEVLGARQAQGLHQGQSKLFADGQRVGEQGMDGEDSVNAKNRLFTDRHQCRPVYVDGQHV